MSRRTPVLRIGAASAAALCLTTVPQAATAASGSTPPGLAEEDTLRRSAPKDFRIGSAVAGGGHHATADYPGPFPSDPEYRSVLAREFSSLTPENQMKWEFVHPEEDVYDFGPADDIVDFAEANGQVVRGHTLFWHSQNPDWLESGDHIDVRGPVGADGQMSAELRQQQADWFRSALEACLAVEGCTSFTVWGVLDQHSWVPNTFPGFGDALTMEGDHERKPAHTALQETLVRAHPGGEAKLKHHPAFR